LVGELLRAESELKNVKREVSELKRSQQHYPMWFMQFDMKELIFPEDVPLGILPHVIYQEQIVPFESNAVLVECSDSINIRFTSFKPMCERYILLC
jgi:regulatory protein YycH of two-component signal transduction system YycFG